MRRIETTPSLTPTVDVTVYLVLDDFGSLGRSYRDIDDHSNVDTVIENLLAGKYEKPLRVVAFNTVECWARDVSEDVAWEILKRVAAEGKILPPSTRQYTEFHVGERETLLAENSVL